MKALGIVQFHQKKFKLMDLTKSPLRGTLGAVPLHFICVIGGYSGNGKTEFCIRLAKELCNHGKVAWLSYEQRHGFDLQTATKRNKMEEQSGQFIPIDPIEGLQPGVSFLEDLDRYLSKRNSPEYIFIDSVDYTGWKKEDYIFLKEKYEGKKTFVFICHTDKGGNPRKSIANDIIFDGGMFLLVKQYICTPLKNRFGGFDDFVIWEQKARELNPAYFAARVKDKKGAEQKELFADSAELKQGGKVQKAVAKTEGYVQNMVNENKGVRANLQA